MNAKDAAKKEMLQALLSKMHEMMSAGEAQEEKAEGEGEPLSSDAPKMKSMEEEASAEVSKHPEKNQMLREDLVAYFKGKKPIAKPGMKTL